MTFARRNGFFAPDNTLTMKNDGSMRRFLLLAFLLAPILTMPALAQRGVPSGAYNSGNGPSAATESLGTQLRRLAAAAQISNPVLNTPLGPAPTWAASTAYAIGQIVSNGGYQYICSVAGTSAGSGGPTGQGMGPIADNTVTWFYYGFSTPSAAAANQPVITQSATVPSGLTNTYAYNANPSPFYYTGGTPHTTGSSMYILWSQTTGTSATAPNASNGYIVTFITDATKIAVKTSSGQQTGRYIIDGQYVTISGYVNGTGATPSYDVIDFTNAGARKNRKISVEMNLNNQFGGVSVAPTEEVWAPTAQDRIRVVWVGDSISASGNSTPALNGAMVPQQVAYLLGWSDVWNDGIGGTGYVATNAGNNYTFGQRIGYDVTPWSPNLVVFLGSINDVGQSGIQAAALSAYQAVRAALPGVPIIVAGIPPDSPNNGGSANITTAESALQAAVTQFGDPLTFFIPINNDATGAWITGTGKVTATNGTGNADAYISSDGVHPTDMGRLYLSRKLAIAIQNVLAQIP